MIKSLLTVVLAFLAAVLLLLLDLNSHVAAAATSASAAGDASPDVLPAPALPAARGPLGMAPPPPVRGIACTRWASASNCWWVSSLSSSKRRTTVLAVDSGGGVS
mgnify:CR=1 FL=1